MSAFDDAWSLLKALEEQQMYHPEIQGSTSMHPAIQGMLARRGIYHGPGDGKTFPVNYRATDASFGRQAERDRRSRGDIDPNQLSRGSVFGVENNYPSRHRQGEGGLFHLPLDQNPDYLAYLARGGRPVSQAYIEQNFKDRVEGY